MEIIVSDPDGNWTEEISEEYVGFYKWPLTGIPHIDKAWVYGFGFQVEEGRLSVGDTTEVLIAPNTDETYAEEIEVFSVQRATETTDMVVALTSPLHEPIDHLP